jgi:oligosaccharyltransferase complex subunit beta
VALSAEATAYSHDPKKAMPDPPTLPVGASAALVSLVQVSCHDETAHMTL